MIKKINLNIVGLVFFALILIGAYQFLPLLLPQTDETVLPDPGCNLQQQTCTVTLSDGTKVALTMGTQPVPMITPFIVSVKADGFVPKRLEVDFTGVDMNMGLNRPTLVLQTDGAYSTEASLPVCISGQMDWLVTLFVERGRLRTAIPFRLTSVGH
ncbi:MAG: hypothetical protein RIR18_852 [Pseudomonadota bacterium]